MSEQNVHTEEDFATQGAGAGGAAILIENVTKRYGSKKAAVNQLTLEIPAGKIVAFVGPSGCGKTTTLKMINRLIEPTEGRIVINGEDVTHINGDKLRRGIGYVIQAGGLLPHLTVGANIAMVPKMLKWDKQRIADRVDELLDLVNLDPEVYRDRYPKQLSGGQQQRVGVARALAADPPVLLMDEPFGAVDPITRQYLQDELISIQSELQKTIVCVTHDFDEALKNIGLSRQDFCNITGLAYSSVSNWNDEKKPIPSWVDSWIQNYKFKNFYDVVKTEFDKQKDI